MPTLLVIDGFRFYFYSNEGNEPPHVHIEKQDCMAKYWLNSIQLAESHGFRSHELTKIRALVMAHREHFLEKWHEYFGR